MARYLYFCSKCHEQFEVEKSMAQAGVVEGCPHCQQNASRVFTAPGIQIKGAKVACDSAPSEACHACDQGCCHSS